MVEFSRTKPKISRQQIEDIETFIGLQFPEAYKSHLLEYNGGKCNPNAFSFNENGKLSTSSIDWFYSISDGEHNNLQDYLEIYKIDEKRMPFHIMPIAHDAGGNLICISCGKDDFEHIYFWDHENEVDYSISDDTNYSNLYLMAKSFVDFINGLK